MANITQILGTDSVSSSRVVINDNFTAINSDLADIAALLNVANQSIALSGSAAFGSIDVATGKVTINQTALTSTVPTTINAKFTLGAASILSVKNIATGDLPAETSFIHAIYKIDGTTVPSVNLNLGEQGQEIFLLAENAAVTVSVTNVAGTTALTINANGSVSLKFAGTKWFIVGSHDATIA
jgi:hypothetical protein